MVQTLIYPASLYLKAYDYYRQNTIKSNIFPLIFKNIFCIKWQTFVVDSLKNNHLQNQSTLLKNGLYLKNDNLLSRL